MKKIQNQNSLLKGHFDRENGFYRHERREIFSMLRGTIFQRRSIIQLSRYVPTLIPAEPEFVLSK